MSKRLKLQLGGEAEMEERAFANPYPDYQPHGAGPAAVPSTADTQRDKASLPPEEESLPFGADGKVSPGRRAGAQAGAASRPPRPCLTRGALPPSRGGPAARAAVGAAPGRPPRPAAASGGVVGRPAACPRRCGALCRPGSGRAAGPFPRRGVAEAAASRAAEGRGGGVS